ncbi:MAG: hypothetical protein N2376_02795 [Clostridia bacterium]|nr:hypothetical protein [Clostridia bacterium]
MTERVNPIGSIPLALLITVFMLLVLYVTYTFPTPNITITYERQNLTAKKYTLGWDTLLYRSRANFPTPPHLLAKEKGYPVKSGASLKIGFSRSPDMTVTDVWTESGVSEACTLKGNELLLPSKPGVYYYSFIGHWNQGQILYAIKVIVE